MQDWPILSLFIARTKGVPFMPSVVGDVHKRLVPWYNLECTTIWSSKIGYVTKLHSRSPCFFISQSGIAQRSEGPL